MVQRRCVLRTLATLGAGVAPVAMSHPVPPPFPRRMLSLVVPFSPGGPTDVLARALAERFSARMGQPTIVENRAGAAGSIGARAVATADPDGHTLLVSVDSSLAFAPLVRADVALPDVTRTLQPVSSLATFSQMLVVPPDSRLTHLAEFMHAARQGMSYASSGNGTPGHLAMEMLIGASGARLAHIPYRGAMPALNDLLGGHVESGFLPTPAVLNHVRRGRLRALAVSGSRRSRGAPEVPTVAELGHPQATTELSFLLLAPADTPQRAVRRLSVESRHALSLPQVRERLQRVDMEPVWASPDDTVVRLRLQMRRWAEVAARVRKQAG